MVVGTNCCVTLGIRPGQYYRAHQGCFLGRSPGHVKKEKNRGHRDACETPQTVGHYTWRLRVPLAPRRRKGGVSRFANGRPLAKTASGRATRERKSRPQRGLSCGASSSCSASKSDLLMRIRGVSSLKLTPHQSRTHPAHQRSAPRYSRLLF